MKIVKTIGHDKKGKKVDIFYGVFKVQGSKKVETIFTNNYRTANRAFLEIKKKMAKYTTIIE